MRQKNPGNLKIVACQKGSALLEGMIAILIFSFGILAIMGLQAASLQNSTTAKYRTDASLLAGQIIGQMWADQANISNYASGTSYVPKTTWNAQVAATLPKGTGNIVVGAGNQVTVTVSWQAPGAASHSFVSVAQIQ